MKSKSTKTLDPDSCYSYKTTEYLADEFEAYNCFEYVRKNVAIKSSGELIKNVELITWVAEYKGTDKNIVCNNNHQVFYVVIDDREKLEYDRPYYVFRRISDAMSAVNAINRTNERKDYFSIVSKTIAIVPQRELQAHGYPYRLPSVMLQKFMQYAEVRLKTNESKLLFKGVGNES